MLTQQKTRQSQLLPCDLRSFYNGVVEFFLKAVTYGKMKLPHSDPVLQNAGWVDSEQRSKFDFDSVKFFTERFPSFLSESISDSLFDEFQDYQTMQPLPDSVLKKATVVESEERAYYRPDVILAYLLTLKDGPSNKLLFGNLARIALLILSLPHSNADERIFNLKKSH